MQHMGSHGKKVNSETVENLNINEQVSQHVAANSEAIERNIKRLNYKSVDLSKINKSQCHICKRIFTGKYSVRAHIRAVHLQVKPNKCELCDYRCFNKCDLTKHMKVHEKTREKRISSKRKQVQTSSREKNVEKSIVSDKVNISNKNQLPRGVPCYKT